MRDKKSIGLVAMALMLGTTVLGQADSAQAAVLTGPTVTAEQAAIAAGQDRPVVVLLRNQPAPVPAGTSQALARRDAVVAAQTPVLSELSRVHATRIRKYTPVNAVAATMSTAAASSLAANPAVAAVIPDSVVKLAAPQSPAATGPTTDDDVPAPAPAASQSACPAPGKVMLEPEALSVTHTDSDDPTAKTARSLGFTGAGVKVAYIADGIDVNNPDFIRADGSHVFADYQDFTGMGTDTPQQFGEGFIDASAIAAQGRVVYDANHYRQYSPGPCDIRIEGTAPGVSMYGFQAGNSDGGTVSALLESIDYATTVDHVDVINESFGINPFPDSSSADALRLFDDAAVAAGVTVTVAAGDAGTTSNPETPAPDPGVIAVGASTTYRWYDQTDYVGADTFAPGGWLDDNVSPLSSNGVNQAGRSIDLLAPGDLSFSLCSGCLDVNGNPQNIARSGGTSESAPLTAGAAALVIQAYRQAHHGASPTPALVKQILVSTADDLTEPGAEQGAGRLNSYKAVLAALSIHDGNGTPAPTGSTLLTDQTQLDATGLPGSTQHWQVTVTNTGAGTQSVDLSGRGFGPPHHTVTGSVTLDDATSPHFADWTGDTENYGKIYFTVPAGTDRLDSEIVYPGDPNSEGDARVRLLLVDPLGRLAAHSIPQGVSDTGHVDVRLPTAGTWTAVITGTQAADGGTVGKVSWQASMSNTTGFGSVSPSRLTLAPGQTGTVDVSATVPAQPGDTSGSLVLNAGAGGQTSIPIVMRGLVDTTHGSGTFAGTLTGGNGRQPNLGQTNYYQFDVPAGNRDVAASVDLTSDPGDTVSAFLIDPTGNEAAIGTNDVTTSYDPTDRSGDQTSIRQTDLYARDPRAGRWTLAINFAGAVAGDELSQPFTGRIGVNTVDVGAPALPDDTHTVLPAGSPLTVPVTVHNTGTAPQDFFLDPRLDSLVPLSLAAVQPATGVQLPAYGNPTPAWLVPTETVGVGVVGRATLPITFDFGPEVGDPDLVASVTGTTAVGLAANRPPAGVWAAEPQATGPFPAAGVPGGTVDMTMAALTKAFDPAVSSPATDLWQSAVTPAAALHLVTVQPGQTVTIPVTITPSGAKGTTVHGTLYVDNLVVGSTELLSSSNFFDSADTEPNANELTGIPYEYTIG